MYGVRHLNKFMAYEIILVSLRDFCCDKMCQVSPPPLLKLILQIMDHKKFNYLGHLTHLHLFKSASLCKISVDQFLFSLQFLFQSIYVAGS